MENNRENNMENNMENKIITFEIWDCYYRLKKYKILNTIEKNNVFDKSNEYNYLISCIKKISNDIDLFDLSRISFLCLSFLDKYIGNYLLNIITKYSIQNDQNDQNYINESEPQTGEETQLDTEINVLLEIILDIIPMIELLLNMNFLILLDYILKYEKNTIIIKSINNIYNIHKYKKIIFDIKSNTSKSSWLLFCIKCMSNKELMLNKFLQNDTTNIIRLIINKIFMEYEKINHLLDEFIIQIEYLFSNNTNNADNADNADNIYTICINFIIKLAELFFTIFKIGYDELIKLLIVKSKNSNDNNNSTTKISLIGKCIINFIEIEKQKIINKLKF